MKIVKDMKDKIPSGKLDTYIGEGTSFDGDLISKQNLSIYGSIKGTIECQGRVVVGESGNVEADILANEVVISGKVTGNLTAKSRLEMVSTGVIQGDIKTMRLIMEDGSKFDGHCEMLSDGKPTAKKAKAADESPAVTSEAKTQKS